MATPITIDSDSSDKIGSKDEDDGSVSVTTQDAPPGESIMKVALLNLDLGNVINSFLGDPVEVWEIK